jgi:hypothetical protein
MAELENEATQYESHNKGSGNTGGSDSYESPSPLHPPCAKRHRGPILRSGTTDTQSLEIKCYNLYN